MWVRPEQNMQIGVVNIQILLKKPRVSVSFKTLRRYDMNERIRELAEQASHQSPDGYPVTIPYSKDFVVKFAELIVRECNQAVLDVPCYYKDYRAQIEEAVINDCARAVLEHFGVE